MCEDVFNLFERTTGGDKFKDVVYWSLASLGVSGDKSAEAGEAEWWVIRRRRSLGFALLTDYHAWVKARNERLLP